MGASIYGQLEKARRVRWSGLISGAIRDLMHPPSGQIPYLDGLRTIAILLVVDGHTSAQFAKTFGSNLYERLPFVRNGWIGVDLFFILSGFFIGGQLWKELRRTGRINVGRFVLRRGFRIWPLYFFMFFVVSVVSLCVGHSLAPKQFGWTDLVFLTNYLNHGIVEGSWSLCTEEQFYIVVPVALYLLAGRIHHLRDCRKWLWAMLLAAPALRGILWVAQTGHFFVRSTTTFAFLYYPSITHCDGLIMGLLIANLWVASDAPRSKLATPWLLAAYSVGISAVLFAAQSGVFSFFVLALFFGAFAWLGLQRQFAIFNGKIFYWISRLSFGMYLNHEYMCPVVVRWIGALGRHVPVLLHWPAAGNLAAVVLVVAMSMSASLVTFCLVEHPFLEMRKVYLGH
jgi:peptidoglycan/LPS O-acetylase OafA/YrhL